MARAIGTYEINVLPNPGEDIDTLLGEIEARVFSMLMDYGTVAGNVLRESDTELTLFDQDVLNGAQESFPIAFGGMV